MKYLKQFGMILFISFLGEILRAVIPLPIPASIYGLVLMLTALLTGILPLEKVRDTGKFLIEIMPLMFIPAAVGLLDSWSALRPILLSVAVITVVTTVAVMGVSGRVTQFVIRRDRRKNMSVQLLDKTRKINKLLHNNNSSKVVFNDICEVLTGILDSNILVISKKGKVLGSSVCKGVEELQELIVDEVGGYIDAELNERLLGILSTKENVNLETLGFGDESKKYRAIITPIDIAGERLGTLFEYRCETEYDIDDIILTEYGTTVGRTGNDAFCKRRECRGSEKGCNRKICDQHTFFLGT